MRNRSTLSNTHYLPSSYLSSDRNSRPPFCHFFFFLFPYPNLPPTCATTANAHHFVCVPAQVSTGPSGAQSYQPTTSAMTTTTTTKGATTGRWAHAAARGEFPPPSLLFSFPNHTFR